MRTINELRVYIDSKLNKKPDGCWEWTGSLYSGTAKMKYGVVQHGGKRFLVHRIVYELIKGAIPNGLCVLHRCDNPKCCNPDHLYLGTYLDNNRDCVNRGRRADQSGEKNGHSILTEEQVRQIRALYRAWDRTFGMVPLGQRFGVSANTIRNVVHYRHWQGV